MRHHFYVLFSPRNKIFITSLNNFFRPLIRCNMDAIYYSHFKNRKNAGCNLLCCFYNQLTVGPIYNRLNLAYLRTRSEILLRSLRIIYGIRYYNIHFDVRRIIRTSVVIGRTADIAEYNNIFFISISAVVKPTCTEKISRPNGYFPYDAYTYNNMCLQYINTDTMIFNQPDW